jgi:thiol-disulfide isomerase/thioredoxin
MFPLAVSEIVYRFGALLIVAVLALVVGALVTRRQGRARSVAAGDVLTAGDLRIESGGLGRGATLLQFSSPVCSGCRQARRVLGEVAAARAGVVHLEIDAEQRLDLVRRLRVSGTPTTFVLDGAGRVSARLAGAPSPVQVYEALALAGVPVTPSSAEV